MSDKPYKFVQCDGERTEIPPSGDNWKATLDTIGTVVGGRVLAIQGDGAEIHETHGRREFFRVTCADGRNGSVEASVILSYR